MDKIEYVFSRYGTFKSLQKDAEIMRFFFERPMEKIRQKTVIERFKDVMTPKTVREHLYRLVEKGLLEEVPDFKGTYMFFPMGFREFAVDMDRLVRELVGRDIYDCAVAIYEDKHKRVASAPVLLEDEVDDGDVEYLEDDPDE